MKLGPLVASQRPRGAQPRKLNAVSLLPFVSAFSGRKHLLDFVRVRLGLITDEEFPGHANAGVPVPRSPFGAHAETFFIPRNEDLNGIKVLAEFHCNLFDQLLGIIRFHRQGGGITRRAGLNSKVVIRP